MSQPSSTGPADAVLAVCGHTHLFPGARCRIQGLSDPRAFAQDPQSIELELRLSGDAGTQAELLTVDPSRPALSVSGYVTGAGTPVDARTWLIRELVRTGDDVDLTIGGQAPTLLEKRAHTCRQRTLCHTNPMKFHHVTNVGSAFVEGVGAPSELLMACQEEHALVSVRPRYSAQALEAGVDARRRPSVTCLVIVSPGPRPQSR